MIDIDAFTEGMKWGMVYSMSAGFIGYGINAIIKMFKTVAS